MVTMLSPFISEDQIFSVFKDHIVVFVNIPPVSIIPTVEILLDHIVVLIILPLNLIFKDHVVVLLNNPLPGFLFFEDHVVVFLKIPSVFKDSMLTMKWSDDFSKTFP